MRKKKEHPFSDPDNVCITSLPQTKPKKPQLCPECKRPLAEIIPESQGECYRWDEEEGKYEVDDAQVTMNFLCGNCKKVIGGWRSDGESWGIVPEVE